MRRRLKELVVVEHAGTPFEGPVAIELVQSLRLLAGRREVYRGHWVGAEREVVVKGYLPHRKQQRDWRREWQGLLQLQASGLPVPTPLLVAEDTEGSVYVVMECLVQALTLGEVVASASHSELRTHMQELAKLVAALHQAGVRQTDQHIDNWALSAGKLYVLDAGTFRFVPAPLGAVERLIDTAAICATLPPQAEGLFRAALRTDYSYLELGFTADRLEAGLENAIARVQRARVRRYYKKTQRACTEFAPCTRGRWRGMLSQKADTALIHSVFADPEHWMQQGQRIKSGNTCTVQSFDFGSKRYVLKRYNQKPLATRIRRGLSASRARRSWSNSWVLNLSFIATAPAIAYLEEAGFPRRRSYLLMEAVDAVLLPDYVARHREDAQRMEALVQAIGAVWGQLARIAAVHGDLKASNWMVDSAGQVFLIDLDSLRFDLSARAFKRGQHKDLNRFLKNWQDDPALADRFTARFL